MEPSGRVSFSYWRLNVLSICCHSNELIFRLRCGHALSGCLLLNCADYPQAVLVEIVDSQIEPHAHQKMGKHEACS